MDSATSLTAFTQPGPWAGYTKLMAWKSYRLRHFARFCVENDTGQFFVKILLKLN